MQEFVIEYLLYADKYVCSMTVFNMDFYPRRIRVSCLSICNTIHRRDLQMHADSYHLHTQNHL